MPQEIPLLKKRTRYNEVDHEKDETLVEIDKVTLGRQDQGEEWSKCSRDSGEIQVDIPLLSQLTDHVQTFI